MEQKSKSFRKSGSGDTLIMTGKSGPVFAGTLLWLSPVVDSFFPFTNTVS
jgi:hypothetical protein